MYPRWTKGVISKNLDSMTPILSPGQPREQYLRILTQWRQYYAVVIIWWNFHNSTFNGEKFKENWIWNAFRIFFLNKWFYMKYIGNYLSVESLFDWYFVKSLGSYISWFFTLWGQDYPQVNRRSDISDSWLYDACLYDTKTILLLSSGEFYISKHWTVCYCRILSIQLLYWNDHLINIFSLDLIRTLVKIKDR